jgi:hypothetical protein
MGGSATSLALHLRLHKTAWGRTACIGYLLTICPLPANCRADSVLSTPAPKNRSWPGPVRSACGSETYVGTLRPVSGHAASRTTSLQSGNGESQTRNIASVSLIADSISRSNGTPPPLLR